jgi:endoglucanase
VACDYNAGFTGLLAHLYSKYKGQTIKDFGAVETPGLEIYADGAINVTGDDFIEVKAFVYNITGWPARVPESIELRYFVDLSEVVKAGGSASDIEVTTNYMQSGSCEGLKVWDEAKNIYYVSIVFDDKSLYPGGQSEYKKEIQVRIRNTKGVWDDSNDPSFEGLASGNATLATNMAVYENGVLVFGTTPPSGDKAGESVVNANGGASNGKNGNNSSNANNSNNNNNSNNSGNSSQNSNDNNDSGNNSGSDGSGGYKSNELTSGEDSSGSSSNGFLDSLLGGLASGAN